MPSLRQKIAGLLRQLPTSPNDNNKNVPPAPPAKEQESFVQKYLNGHSRNNRHATAPEIVFGRCCYDLPMRQVARLSRVVVAAHTGPGGGLASVNRRHQPLEYLDLDVDFIDECEEEEDEEAQVRPPPAKILPNTDCPDEVAGIKNWNCPDDRAFGLAKSLYEKHPTTKASAGDPLADAFAVCLRENSCVLALADGVNWGDKSCLAARCAVHGCVDYLNNALYSGRIETTMDVFVCLLRSFHAAHNLILQEEGSLTTLCAAVVCPLRNSDKSVVCACNVGDSLAYLYSRKHGVREITQGSHDIHSMRDMRDALGALGPVDGVNPELSNLTVSMTTAERGDIVFLCSDGVSDNFDPVVGKFAVPHRRSQTNGEKKAKRSSSRRQQRSSNSENAPSELPSVEAHQRHHLSLLRMEEELNDNCSSARGLCESLVGFAERLTAQKRSILEDPSLYDPETPDSQQEQRLRRRRVAERLGSCPGKLDHATVVACRVGDYRAKSPARPPRHRSKSPRVAKSASHQKNSVSNSAAKVSTNSGSKVSRGMKTEPCNLESSI